MHAPIKIVFSMAQKNRFDWSDLISTCFAIEIVYSEENCKARRKSCLIRRYYFGIVKIWLLKSVNIYFFWY